MSSLWLRALRLSVLSRAQVPGPQHRTASLRELGADQAGRYSAGAADPRPREPARHRHQADRDGDAGRCRSGPGPGSSGGRGGCG